MREENTSRKAAAYARKRKKKIRKIKRRITAIFAVAVMAIIAGNFVWPSGDVFIWKGADAVCASVKEETKLLSLPAGNTTEKYHYEQAFSGDVGWINYFGKVNVYAQAREDSAVVGSVVYKNKIGTFGKSINGYHRIKYVDSVSGKILTGFCSDAVISREEIVSPGILLNVPDFKQDDSQWAAIELGAYETMESAGCTTTCLAMSNSCVSGEIITPGEMSERLKYDYDGNLSFPESYEKYFYRDYLTIAYRKLREGIPVLLCSARPSGFTHWILIVGYTGDGEELYKKDFLIYDPISDRENLAQYFEVFPNFSKIAYYIPKE